MDTDPFSTGVSTLKQQLYALGTNHVGFNAKPFDTLGLSVVGGRPFSRGGSLFKRWGEEGPLWQLLYGVSGYDNSARLVHKRVTEQHPSLALILLGRSS